MEGHCRLQKKRKSEERDKGRGKGKERSVPCGEMINLEIGSSLPIPL